MLVCRQGGPPPPAINLEHQGHPLGSQRGKEDPGDKRFLFPAVSFQAGQERGPVEAPLTPPLPSLCGSVYLHQAGAGAPVSVRIPAPGHVPGSLWSAVSLGQDFQECTLLTTQARPHMPDYSEL